MQERLLGGRYQLVRRLGQGGMGQVWEAHDATRLERRVAVKVIAIPAGVGSDTEEARERFLREARITAGLQHPNIVTVHDLMEDEGDGGTDGKVLFLVMELLRGEGLDAVLRRGPVPLPQAADWGAQVCDALDEAHRAGVLHRDIKPSNIQILPSGTAKVLDFGIARAADPATTADKVTRTGFIVGTLPYMAPEQLSGKPEARSDLYALGCVLFEMTTGRLPFQPRDTVGYITAHLSERPPAPSSVRPGIPPAWDELVLTLLSKEPRRRYSGAADVARALRSLGALGGDAGHPTTAVEGPGSASGEALAGAERAAAAEGAGSTAAATAVTGAGEARASTAHASTPEAFAAQATESAAGTDAEKPDAATEQPQTEPNWDWGRRPEPSERSHDASSGPAAGTGPGPSAGQRSGPGPSAGQRSGPVSGPGPGPGPETGQRPGPDPGARPGPGSGAGTAPDPGPEPFLGHAQGHGPRPGEWPGEWPGAWSGSTPLVGFRRPLARHAYGLFVKLLVSAVVLTVWATAYHLTHAHDSLAVSGPDIAVFVLVVLGCVGAEAIRFGTDRTKPRSRITLGTDALTVEHEVERGGRMFVVPFTVARSSIERIGIEGVGREARVVVRFTAPGTPSAEWLRYHGVTRRPLRGGYVLCRPARVAFAVWSARAMVHRLRAELADYAEGRPLPLTGRVL